MIFYCSMILKDNNSQNYQKTLKFYNNKFSMHVTKANINLVNYLLSHFSLGNSTQALQKKFENREKSVLNRSWFSGISMFWFKEHSSL